MTEREQITAKKIYFRYFSTSSSHRRVGDLAAGNTPTKGKEVVKREGALPSLPPQIALYSERQPLPIEPHSRIQLLPICCSATKRSKNNVYVSKLENGTNHPEGEDDNGTSSARAHELTLSARDRKLESHGERLNGTGSNGSARKRGHRWPNAAER